MIRVNRVHRARQRSGGSVVWGWSRGDHHGTRVAAACVVPLSESVPRDQIGISASGGSVYPVFQVRNQVRGRT